MRRKMIRGSACVTAADGLSGVPGLHCRHPPPRLSVRPSCCSRSPQSPPPVQAVVLPESGPRLSSTAPYRPPLPPLSSSPHSSTPSSCAGRTTAQPPFPSSSNPQATTALAARNHRRGRRVVAKATPHLRAEQPPFLAPHIGVTSPTRPEAAPSATVSELFRPSSPSLLAFSGEIRFP
jgi:hypothetical protein